MGDVFRQWVLGSDTAGVDRACFASLGQGIVSRIEILSLFEMFGQVVGFGRELSVEAEQALLVRREGGNVDFVLLVGIHRGGMDVVLQCGNGD